MKSNYWVLRPQRTEHRLVQWAPDVKRDQVTCPLHGDHARAGPRIGELRVTLSSRRFMADIMWTWASECLIGRDVAALLEAHQFRGYKLCPAQVAFEDTGKTEPAWELITTGWAGCAAPESGITLLRACDECGYRVFSCFTNASLLMDHEPAERMDFCMVWPLPRFVMLTERVVNVLHANEITGFGLVSVDNLECKSGTLSPGSLSDWFGSEVAAGLEAEVAAWERRLPPLVLPPS